MEYKRFKDVADRFSLLEFLRSATYPRGGVTETLPEAPEDVLSQKLGDLGASDLLEAFRRVLERSQETVSFGHLKMQRWSVPEKMRMVLCRIDAGTPITFSSLFRPEAPKGEIIVTFVALLELIRLRHVDVRQDELFGELLLEAVPEGTPNAHLPLPEEETPGDWSA